MSSLIILLYSTLDFAVFSCKLPLHKSKSTMARTGLRASAINISLVDFNRSFTFGQNRKFITMEIRFPSALGAAWTRSLGGWMYELTSSLDTKDRLEPSTANHGRP